MWPALRRWREARILRSAALPDALWQQALDTLPFLARYTPAELARLRDLVVLFLHRKGIVGAAGHEVTPLERTIIALQACVLVLELDLALYDDFENVIVYPAEFVPRREWEDDAGVVHESRDILAGEAMPGGPVVLSWPDVAASADFAASGMNLVIHEFAHKIDMCNGDADGFPPLPRDMPVAQWRDAFTAAYDDFCRRVDDGEDTPIDPYAAEHPAEFFAVVSEVFFAAPATLHEAYPDVYAQLAQLYRQDPLAATPAALPPDRGGRGRRAPP
jgi:Mlc titration factor MtfA (ptsG expression regulator)